MTILAGQTILAADLNALIPETGQEVVSFTAQTTFTVPVTFAETYTSAPVVTVNITSGNSVANSWFSTSFGVSTTGFTIWLRGPSATWSNITVDWVANRT